MNSNIVPAKSVQSDTEINYSWIVAGQRTAKQRLGAAPGWTRLVAQTCWFARTIGVLVALLNMKDDSETRKIKVIVH